MTAPKKLEGIETSTGITWEEIVARHKKENEDEERRTAEKEQKRAETLQRVSEMSMEEYIEARRSGKIK